MNILLWFLFALVNFALIVGVYKLFGKTGLFAWIAMGTILANIQVTKSIDFDFGNGFIVAATLGNIMYGTLFLVTDALGEKYGKKEAKKAVYIGFFSLIATVIIMQMALLVFDLISYNSFWLALYKGYFYPLLIPSKIDVTISTKHDIYQVMLF